MPENVLVTGGAGYIGSHVCKLLAENGYSPVVVDNLSKGHRRAVKWGPLEQIDILDTDALKDVFARYSPAAVLHFAASIEVGESVVAPEKYYRNNVGGTLSLLTAMIAHNVKNIVFSSTAATYGNPITELIAESHPQQPINPYGSSKLMVETIIRDCGEAHGTKYVFLRYFNASGADRDGEIGESHDPESHLIPIILQVAHGERDQLKIFGDDYETPDGTCIRDYIHVEDLADAHLRALRHLEAENASEAFNLGTGHGYSVSAVLEKARAITGAKIPAQMESRRAGDPAILVADPSRARAQMGWECKKSLDQIVSSAWNWHSRETE